MEESLFDRISRAILSREPMCPPPHFDVSVGGDVREAYLGRPIRSLRDDVEFWVEAGYCLYPVNFGLLQFGGLITTAGAGRKVARARYSAYRAEEVDMSWAATGKGVICSDEDFEQYPWPDPERMDLSVLDEILPLLPRGMRAIANIGKVFTGTWQLMGFTFFAEALHDQPALVERVFARVAAIQSRVAQRVIEHPATGAILHADDLAYGSGPMVHPDVIRRHVFPTYRHLAEECRQRGILYLFHSDGQVESFLPDIVDCGFVGLHPIEPQAMNADRVKREWGDRLCLLGNIDVDLLARGTVQEVRDQTKSCLDRLARDGGYCPGSGNSVPDYVPLENFIAMTEAVKEWR